MERKKFGEFVRGKRTSLGLSLREFGRRNGLDPGNLSKIERGVAPPPVREGVLNAYAKALRIPMGSQEWREFHELAAAETGRFPTDLQQSTLPAERRAAFRGLRGSKRRPWVNALLLEQWADTLEARSMLPQLVRRLVWATGVDVTWSAHPAGEQINREGYDGLTVAGGGSRFVPEGLTAWELSVERDVAQKARADLEKRTRSPRGLDPSASTFVVVTLRKWPNKDEWLRKQPKRGSWKDVRVYDSATLDEWLEQAPSVDAWLARELGIRPEGLSDVEEYWETLQTLTRPPFATEVFLASRQAEAGRIADWLEKEEDPVLTIAGSTAQDALDFLAAFAQSPRFSERASTRMVIVENREAWRQVAGAPSGGLILIPHPSWAVDDELIAEAVRLGHRVLIPTSRDPGERRGSLLLPSPDREELANALVKSGLEPDRAWELVRESRGRIGGLRRTLAPIHGTNSLPWQRKEFLPVMVPALLAGRWNGRIAGDSRILARLAEKDYAVVEELLEQARAGSDGPLIRTDDRWELAERAETWNSLARSLTSTQLGRFHEAVLEVLGTLAPSFRLPQEFWWGYLRVGVAEFSDGLKTGLAETLALLGTKHDVLPLECRRQAPAEIVVRELLHDQDWKRWFSLADQLPLLAEAAPDEFLGAADADLRRKQHSALREIFDPRRTASGAAHCRARFLAALEVLAWSPDRLGLVCEVLLELADQAPGREDLFGPSPEESFVTIFRPSRPRTAAAADVRLKVLRKVLRDQPTHSRWQLLASLLPNHEPIIAESIRPRFRDWAEGAQDDLVWVDARVELRELVAELLTHVTSIPQILCLLEILRFQSSECRKLIVEKVASSDLEALGGSPVEVVEAVRELVARHRMFKDRDWTLPEVELTGLEQAVSRWDCEDRAARVAWLFSGDWIAAVGLGLSPTDDQWPEEVEKERKRELRQLLEQSGWGSVERLIRASTAPSTIGAVLARLESHRVEALHLRELLGSDRKSREFSVGYVAARQRKDGWAWVEALPLKEWEADRSALLLHNLPFQPMTWEIAARAGDEIERLYWAGTPATSPSCDDSLLDQAISRLLKHGNAPTAIHLLWTSYKKHRTPPAQTVMETLEDFLKGPGHKTRLGIDTELASDLLRNLQTRLVNAEPGIDRNRLSALEWACLDLPGGRRVAPVTLHGKLSDDPEFFVEVMESAVAARPDSKNPVARSRHAFGLLISWKTIPGSRPGGELEEGRLSEWVERARAAASERGLLEPCDRWIGNVFAHSDRDADGAWPCVAIRDALEEIKTNQVFEGFRTGAFNKRGVVEKSPREGGLQERTLAKRYEADAKQTAAEWPRVAKVLRQIAEDFQRLAEREDDEARQW